SPACPERYADEPKAAICISLLGLRVLALLHDRPPPRRDRLPLVRAHGGCLATRRVDPPGADPGHGQRMADGRVLAEHGRPPAAAARLAGALRRMSSSTSLGRRWTAARISTAPITIVKRGHRVSLRGEVSVIAPCSNGLVAVGIKLRGPGLGSPPVSYSASVR